MTEVIKDKLRETATKELEDPIIVLGYVEHQLDLVSQLVIDIAENSDLTDEQKKRLEMLKSIINYSSIDFKNIGEQIQAYKIPKTIENKQRTRFIQDQYLQAQIKKGVFGK